MLTIKGISIHNLTITRDTDGKEKIEGTYHLIANNDRVLAKQAFNGYNDIKLEQSAETSAALVNVMAAVKNDLELQLGIKL